MGLFDRLFGKKKQEDNLETTDISQTADQAEADERPSQADLSAAAESLSGTEQTSAVPEDLPETDQSVPDSVSGAVPETEEVQESAALDPVRSAEQLTETSEASPEIAKDTAAGEEVTASQAESEIPAAEPKSSSADFMAEYYARKAELAQKVESQAQEETDEAVNQSEKEQASNQVTSAAETEEEKYNRSLKKTRTGFGARLNAFLANFRSVDEEFLKNWKKC